MIKGAIDMKFQRFIQKHQNQITLASAILIAIGFVGKYLLQSTIVYDWAFILASIIAAVPIMIHAYQSLRVKVISIELRQHRRYRGLHHWQANESRS